MCKNSGLSALIQVFTCVTCILNRMVQDLLGFYLIKILFAILAILQSFVRKKSNYAEVFDILSYIF